MALAGSVSPTTDTITGSYTNSKMQVEVAIAPRDEAGLNAEISALYDKNSAGGAGFSRRTCRPSAGAAAVRVAAGGTIAAGNRLEFVVSPAARI